MDIRHIDRNYFVSGQITPQDIAAVADAGITTIICNRPDSEIPPDMHASALQKAATQAGIAFHVLPLTHQTMTAANIAAQTALVAAAGGDVLAYCASGTRCTVAWALAQASAGKTNVDDILAKTAAAGYGLDGLRPQLEAIAAD